MKEVTTVEALFGVGLLLLLCASESEEAHAERWARKKEALARWEASLPPIKLWKPRQPRKTGRTWTQHRSIGVGRPSCAF
jgi:hypothetical protein